MTARTLTCIEISCDVCGYVLDQDDDGTVHFDSIAHAADSYGASGESDEWLVRPDGYALCQDSDQEHRDARAAARAAQHAAPEQTPGQTELALTIGRQGADTETAAAVAW